MSKPVKLDQVQEAYNSLERQRPDESRVHYKIMAIGGPELVVAVGTVLVFFLLVYRNMGIFPLVMADEWSYNLFSRLRPFSEAYLPSYLYFWVYRQTAHSGNGFLECARVFNSIFFISAAPFIYRLARQVASPYIAAFIALVSILGAVNSYTAYFMPEAMYFGFFWLLSWFMICFRDARPAFYGCMAGIIIGGMWLIKVHTIFLLPGIALFVVLMARRLRPDGWIRDSVVTLACLFAASGVVRFCLGYLLAGRAGVHLLGDTYGGIADSYLTIDNLIRLTRKVIIVLGGHLLALTLLFGVPLAGTISLVFRDKESSDARYASLAIKLYTILIVVPLLIVVAYFTASLAAAPDQFIGRIHLRYYDFTFPLLYVVAASEIEAKRKVSRLVSMPIAVLVAIAGASSIWLLPSRYSPNVIDSPEIWGIFLHKGILYAIVSLGVAACVLWATNRRIGAQVFLFVVVPICVFTAGHSVSLELRQHLRPSIYERAGMLAKQYLAPDERSQLAIVGPEIAELYKTRFQVDEPNTGLFVLPDNDALASIEIPARFEWIILIGDHPIDPRYTVAYSSSDYRLLSVFGPGSIVFSRQDLRGVARVTGLSGREPIGRWSDSDYVEFELTSFLPRKFNLNLTAGAFGPNVDLPFTVRIGTVIQTFRLPGTMVTVSLPFVTDGKQRTITIDVPRPTAPADIGVNRDVRHLGILLKEMKISPLE